MKNVILILALIITKTTTYSQIKFSKEVKYDSVKNITIVKKEIPSSWIKFNIKNKWLPIFNLAGGDESNQHYQNLKNEVGTELEIGIYNKYFSRKSEILNEDNFIDNFEIHIKWLKNKKYEFYNNKSNNIDYFISNIKKSGIEKSVLFGFKGNKKYVIILYDKNADFIEREKMILDLFNSIQS
ncbi:hypothetical protein [Flavobacterium sp.]|uniref:hypothetical protein n=1 Tax=Flavobacterium sp. TaxID=239 RepID=UPI00286DA416|nr:hypothetical protein [Flavobacterium sp.]